MASRSRLDNEKRKRDAQARADDDAECCVCFTTIVGKAGMLPCGHDKLCVDCIVKVFTSSGKCPLCRWSPAPASDAYVTYGSEEAAEHYTRIAAGRLMFKMAETPGMSEWISDGLKLFDVTTTDNSSVLRKCMDLSLQLHYETDDED